MRRVGAIRALFGAVFLAGASAQALADGPGSTAAAGLKVPPGARPGGMGGAFVGLADDMNALFWNPAGLSYIDAPELSIFYSPYVVGTNLQMLGYANPIPLLGTLAAAITLLDYGNEDRTSERPDGLFGGKVGTANPQDVFGTVGWGSDFPPMFGLDRLKAGLSLKLTFQNVAGKTLSGFGTSAGLLWESPVGGLKLGTVADNLGVASAEGTRSLPISWVLGASYGGKVGKDFQSIYTLDARFSVDTSANIGVGAEVLAFNLLNLRVGWRGGGAEGGPTFGLGIAHPLMLSGKELGFRLDYNTSYIGQLGTAHRFQFSVRMGGARIRNLGSLRLEHIGMEPVLTWTGKAPAYHILFRKAGEESFRQLTDAPVEDTRYPLTGLEPGEYYFQIVEADPVSPDKGGAVSETIRLKLEPALENAPEGRPKAAAPFNPIGLEGASGTIEIESAPPGPPPIPQGSVPEAVPAMPVLPEAPELMPAEPAPLPMVPEKPAK